jgi:hypothetical protein
MAFMPANDKAPAMKIFQRFWLLPLGACLISGTACADAQPAYVPPSSVPPSSSAQPVYRPTYSPPPLMAIPPTVGPVFNSLAPATINSAPTIVPVAPVGAPAPAPTALPSSALTAAPAASTAASVAPAAPAAASVKPGPTDMEKAAAAKRRRHARWLKAQAAAKAKAAATPAASNPDQI